MSLHPDKTLFELNPQLKRDLDVLRQKLRDAGLMDKIDF